MFENPNICRTLLASIGESEAVFAVVSALAMFVQKTLAPLGQIVGIGGKYLAHYLRPHAC